MNEITYKIDFNVNDRLPPIRAFIERLHGVLDPTKPAHYHIDLTKCQYLGPDAVALLAAILFERRSLGQEVRVSLPEGPEKLRAFCTFSGLEALLEDIPQRSDPTDTVIPLRQILSAKWTDADPILNLVNRHLDTSDEVEEYLRICVNEVVQNIEDHAESPIGGVMSARYLTHDQQVRVAIVDRGVGIYTTLKRRSTIRLPTMRSGASSRGSSRRCRGQTTQGLVCAILAL